jgi:thioredoxin-dependent peroxiredoxin
MPAIEVGQDAPDFSATTNSGREVKLSDFKGQKNVVLVMYPGDETASCTRQLCAFRDDFPRFQNTDTEVFGVNPADAESHQRFIDKNGFPFDLIVDENRQIAQSYDSVMLMGFVVKRTVIAIDKEGKIAFFKRGYPTNDEIITALEQANAADRSTA